MRAGGAPCGDGLSQSVLSPLGFRWPVEAAGSLGHLDDWRTWRGFMHLPACLKEEAEGSACSVGDILVCLRLDVQVVGCVHCF